MLALVLCLLLQDPPSQERQPGQPVPVTPNMGIGPREHFATTEQYLYNGRPISGAKAKDLLGAPSLPQDHHLPFLVYVGGNKEDATKTKALLTPLSSRWRIQSCVQGEWYTLKADGSVRFPPGLSVCKPDGRVAYHTQDLAGLLDKLRVLPENFDLDQLADLFRPAPNPLPAPGPLPLASKVPLWAWVVGGLSLLLLLLLRRKA